MRKKGIILLFSLLLVTAQLFGQYNKRYIYYLGSNAIVNKEYYRAIDILSTLIAVDTISEDAYFLRAVAKYNLNDVVGAERDFTQALRINPVFVQAYQYRAITRSFMGNYQDALEDFQRAIDIRPDYLNTFFSRGVTYFLSQQFENAIKDFDRYLRRYPEETDALLNRGTAYLMLKDTTRAFEDYDQAVTVDPHNSQVYLRRGSVYAMQGQEARAIEDFDKSIFYDAKNIGAYFNRAVSYARSNKPLQAIADLTMVTHLDSLNSLAYFNRALLYSQIGDYNKSLDDYDRVAEYSPSNILVYFNRGLLNAKLGNLEDAERDFTQAIGLYPDFANAYLNRADVRYLLGDKTGSKRDRKAAEEKIALYQSRFRSGQATEGETDDFAIYADTSKVFDKLLSFDLDFGNKDFDNVRKKDVEIKLLPQFKFVVPLIAEDTTEWHPDNFAYRNRDIDNFTAQIGIEGLKVSNLPMDYTQEGLKLAAAEHERQLAEQQAPSWVIHFVRGVDHYAQRQYTTAGTDFTRAMLYSKSENPFLYMNRSAVNSEMVEFISSLDNKQQRLVIETDKAKELTTVTREYDYTAALQDIDRAIELNPYVAYFYYNRGNIRCLAGDMAGAIGDYDKAVELYPHFAEAYYNRGLVQISLKEVRKGCLDIGRAGELGLKEAYQVLDHYNRLLTDTDK